MKQILFFFIFILIGSSNTFAQAPKKLNSADIHESIQKLNTLCSVLYVAAHPDDENTNLISYLVNEKHFNARYLSLTRGDGGQNLIGSESQELLGVLRTQELLSARRIDGGEQQFSRANDFGFSKNPEETLKSWDKQAVLSDVVWAIRKFQPDVIINRFSHRTDRPNHGHHTASAQLALEAFDIVNDKNAFPEQLKYVPTWQPKRIMMNVSWWFYGGPDAFKKIDKSAWMTANIGVYFPAKGKSNTEIAAESRSQHRCQSMGTMSERGESIEYFEYLKGEQPKTDLFEGINTTWSRVEGGAPIGELIKNIEKNYNYSNPSASVPALMEAYTAMQKLPDGYWKSIKIEEIKEVIRASLALYLEATAVDYSATPKETVPLNIEITNRSNVNVVLKNIAFLPTGKDTTMNLTLTPNTANKFKTKINIPENANFTSPYWLQEDWNGGAMYRVDDQKLRGLPESPHQLKAKFNLEINNIAIDFPIDISYKWREPARGELFRSFEITPPAYANINEKVYVFADDEAKMASVTIKSGRSDVAGKVSLKLPDGWKCEPAVVDFSLKQKGEETTVSFKISPSKNLSEGQMLAFLEIDGKKYDKEVVFIKYEHIPTQTVLRNAIAKVVKLDLKKEGKRIGYIMGAGDEIPTCLRQIGYEVVLLNERDVNPENLNQYDAIILGVRAYNTLEWLKFAQTKLNAYAEAGGTVIVQYNTDGNLLSSNLAPYSIKLSRDRVTDENAEVRFLKPEHRVLNFPNKITSKDFEGWIQERGIYFAGDWDKEKFEAPISCNDPNEPARDGGLLVAKYGKGYYMYTGYVWFRELPLGVSGAYRLFTNMISIGKGKKV